MLVITSMAALVRTLLAVPAQWPVLSGGVLSAIEQANLDDPLLAVIATSILHAVTQGAVTWAAFTRLRGQQQTALQCWGKSLRLIVPLFCTLIAVAFLTLFGLVCCIVPGVIALAKYALTTPAVTLEGRKTGRAISRSGSLVEGNTGKVLLTVLAAGAIVYIIDIALESALAAALGLPVFANFLPGAGQTVSVATALFSLGSEFLSVLLLPLTTIPCVVLFMTLRDLKEGAELEHQVDRLVDSTASHNSSAEPTSF